MSGRVVANYGRTSLSADNNVLITELTITNIGSQAMYKPLIVVLENFTELDTNVMLPDGVLPDGRPFLDLSDQLAGKPFEPGQTIKTRELRFLNNNGLQFSYRLETHARLNSAPSQFNSLPLDSIAAGNSYRYAANAIDVDDPLLYYSIQSGPRAMTIDALTGRVDWAPASIDIGTHQVLLRATDPHGLYIEQSFSIDVFETLQNRPPNFVSTPNLEAVASSGFEVATVRTGNAPAGIATLRGFSGPRLVTINAGDADVVTYARSLGNGFDKQFSVSAGEPKPDGSPLRVGYSVDVGLPPFLQALDSNTVLGLDQGDFNGDGILDLAALTSRLETWSGSAKINQYTNEILVMLGDGDGQFGSPKALASYVGTNRRDFKHLRVSDINGDGRQDLLAIDEDSGLLISILGNGDGTFLNVQTVTLAVNLNDYRTVDLDQDGKLDIVGRSGDWRRFGWMKGRGDGTFSQFVDIAAGDGNESFALATSLSRSNALFLYVADFSGDGNFDILYSTSNTTVPKLLVGDSSGIHYTLRDIPAPIASWSGNPAGDDAPRDIDGDGDLDVVVVSSWASPLDTSNAYVLINDGQGAFSSTAYTTMRFGPSYDELTAAGNGSVSGALVGDYNRDGVLDMATFTIAAGFNGVGIALGIRPGQFAAITSIPFATAGTGPLPAKAIPGDFNRDGILDLLSFPTSEMFLGIGNGQFQRPFPALPSQGARSQNAISVDFNVDGILDLIYTRDEGVHYYAATGNGDGTFAISFDQRGDAFYSPTVMESADFNKDGFPDFVARYAYDRFMDVYLYNPARPGTFIRSLKLDLVAGGILARGFGGALTTADFNSDGIVDIALGEQLPGEPLKLMILAGKGDDTFKIIHEQYDYNETIFGNLNTPNWFEDGDVNEDGQQDLITMLTSSVVVHLGRGDGSFQSPYYLPDNGCTGGITCPADYEWGNLLDLDGDHHLDLILSTASTRNLIVRLGNGDGTFDPPFTYHTPTSPKQVSFGDLDLDGHMDIASVFNSNFASLFFGKRDGLVDVLSVDLNADGNEEVLAIHEDNDRLKLFAGDNLGGLTRKPDLITGSAPAAVAVADLNRDGKLELLTANRSGRSISVFSQTVGGGYTSIDYPVGRSPIDARAQHVAVGDQPQSLSVADVDADGKPDLLITNRGDDTATIIYNRFDPNEVYRYDADAVDPDGDRLEYRVAEGPGGLFIDSETGSVFWTASPDQVGQHRVVLEADDRRGGVASQSFTIDVRPAVENASPIIATQPQTKIGAAETFVYQAQALDRDADSVRYRLLEAPKGATIDATSGLVQWKGTVDGAFTLNPYGSDGYVQVRNKPSLQPTSLTIESWYKFESLATGTVRRVLIDMGGPSANSAYSLQTVGNSQLVIELNKGNSAQLVSLTAPFVAQLERWYHFAFTFDDDSGVLALFVDGQQVASTVTNKSPIYSNKDLFIGTQSALVPKVSIDNFRIWSVARSTSEIVEGLGRTYNSQPNLVLDYRFEDEVTISVRDHSLAQNNGFRLGTLPPLVTNGLADMGQHRFVIGVEDGCGGFDTQSFQVEVVPELRGTIAGHLFDDANGNGTQQSNEAALAGWKMFIDLNGNAYPDPDEPTATTNSTGDYVFQRLLPGNYPVRVLPRAGYVPVISANVDVIANRQSKYDLAIAQLTLSQVRGSIETEDGRKIAHWKVFADLNDNGFLDDTDPIAVADSLGNYAISGLAAGTYKIRTDKPAGWQTTSAESLTVTLGASAISNGNNFKLSPTNTSVTGGVHFVTTPRTTVEARQTYRYALLAMGLTSNAIKYDLSLAPDGMVIDAAKGLLVWKPTIVQVGQHSVIVRATDSSGSISLHSFDIVVGPPNSPTVFASQPPNTAFVGLRYAYNVKAQDSDNSNVSYRILSGPSSGVIGSSDGQLRWTPSPNDIGIVNFSIEVRDGNGGVANQHFQLSVSNSIPEILPLSVMLPRLTAAAGREYLGLVRGSDALGRNVTWSFVSGAQGVAIQSDGQIRWTPSAADIGRKQLILSATTADGMNQSVQVEIEVLGWLANSAPSIESQPNLSAVTNHLYRYKIVATDLDRDALSFALVKAPFGMSIDPNDGTILWAPADDQLGVANVTVQVTDATGTSTSQQFSLRVGRTSGPPQISSVPKTEAYVGQSYRYSIEARDAEGDPLVYRLLVAPSGMQIESTTGEVSWTPTLDQVGNQTVAIEVSDGIGGATTQSFAIRVRDGVPNQPPHIVTLSPRFGAVGSVFSYSFHATDPEGTSITYSIGRGPIGMIIDPSTGGVFWTPTATQVGKTIITLVATDAGGASGIESFEFDVLAANRNPNITSVAPDEVPARRLFQYDLRCRAPVVRHLSRTEGQNPLHEADGMLEHSRFATKKNRFVTSSNMAKPK